MVDEESEYDLISLPGNVALAVHPAATCAGQSCCIHAPSDHPLRDAPLRWRADRRVMGRVCEHDYVHPDPDHLAHVLRRAGMPTFIEHVVHECDGCCTGEQGAKKS